MNNSFLCNCGHTFCAIAVVTTIWLIPHCRFSLTRLNARGNLCTCTFRYVCQKKAKRGWNWCGRQGQNPVCAPWPSPVPGLAVGHSPVWLWMCPCQSDPGSWETLEWNGLASDMPPTEVSSFSEHVSPQCPSSNFCLQQICPGKLI